MPTAMTVFSRSSSRTEHRKKNSSEHLKSSPAKIIKSSYLRSRSAANPSKTQMQLTQDTVDCTYFDAFQKEELRELLAQCTASWLLSPDFRGDSTLPLGLISNLQLSQDPSMTLLFEKEQGVPELEYREIHQVVRELTTGVFAVNQLPFITLEPNYDLSTTCQLPMAYKDTRIGQLLTDVDYAMKSIWHGVGISKGKREKLSERWRTLLDVNTSSGEYDKNSKDPLEEFEIAGQKFVTSDPKMAHIYDKLNSLSPSELISTQESQFFNTYSDHIKVMMSFHVSRVCSSPTKNIIVCEGGHDITSSLMLVDEDFISSTSLQRINRQLRHQVEMIKRALPLDPEIRKKIAMLKIINAISLIFVALRKRSKIPDVKDLLTELSNEMCRTESELPPFALGSEDQHPNRIFTTDGNGNPRALTHAHGGISFNYDTPEIEQIFDDDWCESICISSSEYIDTIKKQRPKQEYSIPTTFLNGKEYYIVRVPLTAYYTPLPAWLYAKQQKISSLRPRKLPMNDLEISELFKKVFGFRKALSNKNVETGMRMCACRGLTAPFLALLRKTPSSSLLSHDMQGLTVLHDVCTYNRPMILSILLSQNPKLNIRRSDVNDKQTSGTPLQYAARTGSLECLSALIASKIKLVTSDGIGRTAIHHAAAADQLPVVRMLLKRQPDLLEIPALSSNHATPLLSASSSGALTTLKFLIEQGADLKKFDINGDTVVHVAALNFHDEVLMYLVKLSEESEAVNATSLQVWKSLVEMLQSKCENRQDASLRCLEMILHKSPEYWKDVYEAGVIEPLINLLKSRRRRPKSAVSTAFCITEEEYPSPIRSIACSVLCLMSQHEDVRKSIADGGGIPILVQMLEQPGSSTHTDIPNIPSEDLENFDERCELHSRSSVVLSDLAAENASSIADYGGIKPLVDLLQSNVVDLLINVVTTLRALCQGDTDGNGLIQSLIVQHNAASSLVEFLKVKDDDLQSATSETISEICKNHHDNQNEFVRIGVLTPLVEILRGHSIASQTKAALAIGCITDKNLEAQEEAERQGAPEALCRLFQIWSDTVQEKGATALWCLAGQHPLQQRRIAELIGCKQIIEMLISKSNILQNIGCQAVVAWSRNSRKSQELLVDNKVVPPLIRLLRLERTAKYVLLAVVSAVNSLCIGVAHVNCIKAQKSVAEEGAIEILLERIWRLSHDKPMQVDLFHCLSCVVTGCSENEGRLNKHDKFEFDILLNLTNSPQHIVKFGALASLALFAFNRISQQQKIARVGDININNFDVLLESGNSIFCVGAAFQLVVLARMVYVSNVVEVTARGILILVKALDCSTNDPCNHDVILSAASYLASLAHTRAGIPDAFVTSGAVTKLLKHLQSQHDGVRQAASQALGYLSFNRTASRELMAACRGTHRLYQSVISNLGEDGKISDEFVAEFRRQITIGLPIPKPVLIRKEARPKSSPARTTAHDLIKCSNTKSEFIHFQAHNSNKKLS